jgi:hypothetical protein
MSDKLHIVTAGNVLAPAFALLQSLGYRVTHVTSANGKRSTFLQAENDHFRLIAEDPIYLLGLVKLAECRGASWAPTTEEVETFLRFDNT